MGRRAFFGRAAALALAGSGAGAARCSVPAGYALSFADEFDDADLSRINEEGRGGRPGAPAWRSRYRHARSTAINAEKQVYVDPAYAGSAQAPLGLQPFSIAGGVLTISAERVAPPLQPLLGGQRYFSGVITSERTHSQRYGWFEMRARLPPGRGFWPAFWLLPQGGGWPPEIDVLEASGARPRSVHLGLIDRSRAKGRPGGLWIDDAVDTTDGFHTYAAEWTAEDIRFFVDGRLLFASGAHGLHEPMYLLANLAVGSHDPNWIPDPDASTPFPGRLQIDHIRAYRRD